MSQCEKIRKTGRNNKEISCRETLQLSIPSYYVIAPSEGPHQTYLVLMAFRFGHRCDDRKTLLDYVHPARAAEGFGTEVQKRHHGRHLRLNHERYTTTPTT